MQLVFRRFGSGWGWPSPRHRCRHSPGGSRDGEQREQWQKVADIFEAMLVKPGAVVADVGAGDGFFTTRLSAAVGPQGRVLAVDIGADALRRLRGRIKDDQLTNVEVVEGTAADPKLPEGSLDAALIVNAYHEMTEHQAMLARIKAALKPGGRLVIVEPISPSRRDGTREAQARNHEIAVDFVREDARAAGFTQVALHDPFTRRPQGNDDEWMLVLEAAGIDNVPALTGGYEESGSSAATPIRKRRETRMKRISILVTAIGLTASTLGARPDTAESAVTLTGWFSDKGCAARRN